MKAGFSMFAGIYPIWNEHVQMHVEVQGRTKALDEGDGAASGAAAAG